MSILTSRARTKIRFEYCRAVETWKRCILEGKRRIEYATSLVHSALLLSSAQDRLVNVIFLVRVDRKWKGIAKY